MNSNTSTPRTDSEIILPFVFDQVGMSRTCVSADFARQLERELEQAKKTTQPKFKDVLLTGEDTELLDAIEEMARRYCYTDQENMAEINLTYNGASSADVGALRTLAKHGRFRIVRESGRMVVGYWPEHDHEKLSTVVDKSSV